MSRSQDFRVQVQQVLVLNALRLLCERSETDQLNNHERYFPDIYPKLSKILFLLSYGDE